VPLLKSRQSSAKTLEPKNTAEITLKNKSPNAPREKKTPRHFYPYYPQDFISF
jgi:hypothetical protein